MIMGKDWWLEALKFLEAPREAQHGITKAYCQEEEAYRILGYRV